jgi:hypothetical protein
MPRLQVYPLTLVGGGLLVSASACGSASSEGIMGPNTGGAFAWSTGGAPTGGVRGLTGGTVESGGSAPTGGDRAAGGATASGGALQMGGATATGGAVNTGGATASGGASSGGTTATGGATASGGAVATGGSGGAVSPGTCPATPPTAGEPCNDPPRCFYDACPGGNRTLATCNNNSWTVEEGTSCAVECSGFALACPAGTFCRVNQGGALSAQCERYTCGSGPVTAACTPNCAVTYSLEAGVTVTCNTCPQGGCP